MGRCDVFSFWQGSWCGFISTGKAGFILWMMMLLAWATGCQDEPGAEPPEKQEVVTYRAPLQSSKSLKDFAVYSTQFTDLRDRVSSVDGFIGSAGTVQIGNETTVTGDIESVNTVTIGHRSSVFGSVTTGGQIIKHSEVEISGDEDPYTALSTYTIPTKNVTPGSQVINLYSGQSQTVAPGNYQEIHAYGGSTLTLVAGEYNVRRFIIEATSVTLRLDVSGGEIEVKAQDEIQFGDNINMMLIGSDDSSDVTFYTNNANQTRIGTDSLFHGIVYAPYGEVYAFSRMQIHGAIYGKRVIIDTDVLFYGEGDPCDGIVCDAPPEDYCLDANTLREYNTEGACDDGECTYDHVDTPCQYGCENNQCKDPECTSGTCCDNGFYKPQGTVCRQTAGPCDVEETCTGNSGECPTDAFESSATQCRASAGICDVAEMCTGDSAVCPSDTFQPTTTECRASAGICDIAETCTGNSAVCPADVFQPITTECRASAGICDIAETCTGNSAVCPADVFQPITAECRASAGICDVAEMCTGGSADCPVDGFESPTTECRASAGICDVAESCSGDSATCPADGFESSTTECRASAGGCDVAETCTGDSATCPVDGFESSATECRASAGICDVVEMCTGESASCPNDSFQSSSTECRASAGVCDVAESCTGDSATCPDDEFESSATECRASAGDCDVAESCSGDSATCPVDEFESSATECRTSAGNCDVAETCTGDSAACPADVFQPSTTECRESEGICDVPEMCTGDSAVCPTDGFETSSTECRASADICDAAEMCTGDSASCPIDSFQPSSTECRASMGVCDVAESCTGDSAACPSDGFESSATECRASAGECDVAETCTGDSATCPADEFESSSTECRASAGICDVAEMCTGDSATCPSDAFQPTTAECRASAGVCDVAEMCTGSSTDCPVDGLESSATECRASAGDCDVAETCTGDSATCPVDEYASSATECRASAGDCDVAESCSGESATCPADEFASSATECRASMGACDIAENCSGDSVECPADVFTSAGVACRPAVGDCDVPEICSGDDPSCPADGFEPASLQCGVVPEAVERNCGESVCGADLMVREAFAYCDGATADCGTDNVQWHGWDLDETCSAESICVADGSDASCSFCDWGCDSGSCIDPCEGVVCDQPPVDTCLDADTRIVYTGGASCSGGECVYEYQEIACEHGCADGVCRDCSSGGCCGEDGTILDSTNRCGSAPLTQEFSCSDDTCGADAMRRERYQYCNGTDSECGMDNLVWEEWEIIQSCYTYGHCVTDGSDAWCENCELGCAEGACNTELPPDPVDVAPPLSTSGITSLKDATAFIYTGDDPIQKGLDPTIIEEKRVVVLKGVVTQKDDSPLSGVTITLHNRPEFGSTVTREDGEFDLVANGGGQFVVNYQKEGYLPVQRRIKTPWADYQLLPDVVMIPVDPVVNTVDVSGETEEMQVLVGTISSDDFGVRQPNLFIPAGTSAEMVMRDGSRTPIDEIDVRMTEYTVGENGPETMPADLPSTTAYTYAVEMSSDLALELNAKTVEFSQPVYMHLENYLQMPLASIVPIGVYDREKAVWIPEQNGVVVEVIDIIDGRAVIDAYGQGIPMEQDILDWMGVTDDEMMVVAQKYNVGDSFWRIPMHHFSPYDGNYNRPFWIRDTDTDDDFEVDVNLESFEHSTSCEQPGSSIHCYAGSLGETLNLPGFRPKLNYRSDLSKGNQTRNSLKMVVSSKSNCDELREAIDISVNVAGKSYAIQQGICSYDEESETATGTFKFNWDRLDAYSRGVIGIQNAHIEISREVKEGDCNQRYGPVRVGSYPGVGWTFGGYCSPGMCDSVSAMLSLPTRTWCRYNDEVLYEWDVPIGEMDRKVVGMGGLSLDMQHFYDTNADVLYLGNGEKRSVERFGPVISTIPIFPPRGGHLTFFTKDFAFDEEGRIILIGSYDGAPKFDPVFYQYGMFKYDLENRTYEKININLINSELWSSCVTPSAQSWPEKMEMDPQGDLFILLENGSFSTNDFSVWRLDRDNNLTHFAGCGEPEDGVGDGLPATEAQLRGVLDIDSDSNGRLFIGQTNPRLLRMVDTDGIMRTIADTQSGDAMAFARFAVGPDDNIYTLTTEHYPLYKVWRIDVAGEWERQIGCEDNEWTFDRIEVADQIQLLRATDLEITNSGTLITGDGALYQVARLRSVEDGYLRPIGGNGIQAVYPRDGSALQVPIADPIAIHVDPNDNIYFLGESVTEITQYSETPTVDKPGSFVVPDESGRELYVFDRNGRHLATRDALTGADINNYFYEEYEGELYLTAVIDADGNQTSILRDNAGNMTGIVAPDYGTGLSEFERTSHISLDENGNVSQVSLPNGTSYSMVISENGLMTEFQKPGGYGTQFTYDDNGRLLSDADTDSEKQLFPSDLEGENYDIDFYSAEGRQTNYAYEVDEILESKTSTVTLPSGTVNTNVIDRENKSTTTMANGMTSEVTYGMDPRWGLGARVPERVVTRTPDGRENVIATSRSISPEDPIDVMTFDSFTETTIVNARTYTKTYDTDLQQWQYTTPANRTSYTAVDAVGRVTEAWSDSLAPVNVDYDAYGRIEAVNVGSDDDIRTYRFGYDARGFLYTLTDPLERTTWFINDELGRVVTKIFSDTREIHFAYDDAGNITSITPPGKPAHEFDYTPKSLMSDYNPPILDDVLLATTHYEYNLDRQVELITRPDGEQIDFVYDTAGRIESVALPGNEQVSVTYSADGNIDTVTSPDGEMLNYDYDGALPTSTTLSGIISGTVSQNYDNNFWVTSRSVNGGNTVTFSYDGDGLLESAGDVDFILEGATGLLAGTSIGAITGSNTYTEFGELDSEIYQIGETPIYEVSYVRDALGRIERKSERIEGELLYSVYTYNSAGRLTAVYENGEQHANAVYEYDGNGNRLGYHNFRSGTEVVENGTYDDQDRLLTYGTSESYAEYTYSANGELESKTKDGDTTYYEYDVLGNLQSVDLPDGTAIEYIVDAQNRRVGKVVNGTLEQGLLYKDALNPIAELDTNGNVISRFVYGSKFNVPDYFTSNKEDGSTWQTYRIISNHLGSPRMVVNTETGEVVQRIDYDEFGRVLEDANPGFQPFGFAGGLYDSDTGLVRFGARDYDADTGRWTAKDPILFRGGVNLYGYVMNDPVNWVDIFGLTQQDIDAAVHEINRHRPDLDVPPIRADLNNSKADGRYNSWTDQIQIDSRYLNELNDEQSKHLLNTIIHETIHANDPWWMRVYDRFQQVFTGGDSGHERTEPIYDDIIGDYLDNRDSGICRMN